MPLSPDLKKEITIKDLKGLFLAFLPLFLTIAIILLIGNFLYKRINSERQKLSIAKRNEEILIKKEAILKQFSTQAESLTKTVVLAIPPSNSSPVVVSQLKNLAAENLTTISSVKASSSQQSASGLKTAQIKFDLDGSIDQVLTYLEGIKEILPLSLVDNLSITPAGGDIVRATIVCDHFYSEYPAKLPKITDPINEITDSELNLISELSFRRQPAFFELEPTVENGVRESPF